MMLLLTGAEAKPASVIRTHCKKAIWLEAEAKGDQSRSPLHSQPLFGRMR